MQEVKVEAVRATAAVLSEGEGMEQMSKSEFERFGSGLVAKVCGVSLGPCFIDCAESFAGPRYGTSGFHRSRLGSSHDDSGIPRQLVHADGSPYAGANSAILQLAS